MRNICFSCLQMKQLFNKEGYFTVMSKLRELIAAFLAVGQLNTKCVTLETCYNLKYVRVSPYLLCTV